MSIILCVLILGLYFSAERRVLVYIVNIILYLYIIHGYVRSACVCESSRAFVAYENVFLSGKMLFCHWFYRRDCCKENTRVTEPVLGRFDWVFNYNTNRNTVRFLKFRKSLEYFECIIFYKITRSWWSELKTKSMYTYCIPTCSRLPSKRALYGR